MDDLEMTRLCAEAMVMDIIEYPDALTIFVRRPNRGEMEYRPLHNDAQAMALVKKFGLAIRHECRYPDSHIVWIAERLGFLDTKVVAPDLNRAIVECVSTLARHKKDAG